MPALSRLLPTALLLLGVAGIWLVPALYGGIFRTYTHTEAGTYSDFSQTWVATQALLFHGQNPYSPALVPRIQEAYYGYALRGDDPHRPTHPQGFYYPLYIMWLTWPFAFLPLAVVTIVFKLLAVSLLVGGTYGYLSLWRRPPPPWRRGAVAASILLTLGAQAAISSDQPTVLLFGLLMAALVAAGRGHYAVAGVLLALATIKPQLALLPALGLVIWSLGRAERRSFLWGGVATGAALLSSSLLLLPSWPLDWLHTFVSYTAATAGSGLAQGRWVDWLGLILRVCLALLVFPLWWSVRRRPLTDGRVGAALAITLVINLAVQQPWFIYNLVLLYPALLGVWAAFCMAPSDLPAPPRTLSWVALALFALPWLVYPGLGVVYLLRLVPITGLTWPSFAALFLITVRIIGDSTVVTALFACLAWLPGLLRPPPSAPVAAAAPPHTWSH